MHTEKNTGDTAGLDFESRPTEYMKGYSGSSETMIANKQKQSNVLAWLVLVKGDQARIGTTFRLLDDITSIGRSVDNEIVLSDEAASAYHAKVRIEDGKFMLYDLVTTNGTFVNGEEIRNSQEIKENDKVQIGETALVFKKI